MAQTLPGHKNFEDAPAKNREFFDVAELRLAEQAIARLRRIFRALSGIGTLIVRASNRQQLFEDACRIAVEQGGFRCAWIGRLDDDGVMKPVAMHGHEEGCLAILAPAFHAKQLGSTIQMANAARTYICNDVAADPVMAPWRGAALARGLRASAALPLCSGGRLVGCFELYSDQADVFDSEAVKLLEVLAADMSYSMEFIAREMSAAVSEKHSLTTGLRQALERNEFVLHYQPKISLSTGRICGAEALARWNSPDFGSVPPSRFVPLLEETGLIVEFGRRVLLEAVQEYRRLRIEGLLPPPIAVNVSSLQLRQHDFVSIVRDAISTVTGEFAPIELEVTESMLMMDIESTIPKLSAIRALGVAIAIDDFGTGYSSLAYLSRLPVSAIKIDRSFIMSMADDADGMSIVSTIITLAHSMDLKVIAEGVDTEEQLKFLRLLKCDQMQGFLFSKALCAGDFELLLRKSQRDCPPQSLRLPLGSSCGIATI